MARDATQYRAEAASRASEAYPVGLHDLDRFLAAAREMSDIYAARG